MEIKKQTIERCTNFLNAFPNSDFRYRDIASLQKQFGVSSNYLTAAVKLGFVERKATGLYHNKVSKYSPIHARSVITTSYSAFPVKRTGQRLKKIAPAITKVENYAPETVNKKNSYNLSLFWGLIKISKP